MHEVTSYEGHLNNYLEAFGKRVALWGRTFKHRRQSAQRLSVLGVFVLFKELV